MSHGKRVIIPLCQCFKRPYHSTFEALCGSRAQRFSTSLKKYQDLEVQQPVTHPLLDPNLVATRRDERRLLRTGVQPIGSRRRRAALASSSNIPFEQLPYQCFQEARKVLQADREEKLQQIKIQRERIARLHSQDASVSGGEPAKQHRLASMHRYLEQLKILADINDPIIKKRFEDGLGDMSRPIYRYMADRKWREYRRPLVIQRITQMNVIPDVLPTMEPVADVTLAFGRRRVEPGEFVDSRVSEIPARLNVQVFDKGERLVSIAVVDADVPNSVKDGFDYRCHFLASNISISPTSGSIHLGRLETDSQVILPWLPPFAQKGSPYHRLPVFVMRQKEGRSIDTVRERERWERDGFKLRSFVDRHRLDPVGVTMFRSIWDEGTAGVMQRAKVEGADVEFRRKRVEPLPYKKKDGSRYR